MDVVAEGFGRRVTGGGASPTVFWAGKLDELRTAIDQANADPDGSAVVVTDTIKAKDGEVLLPLTGTKITIYGNKGTSLKGIGFVVGPTADDILFQNLTFDIVEPDGKEAYPDDTIVLSVLRTPGTAGYWIDHCTFKGVPDQNIQLHADAEGSEWLLLSISDCRFEGNTDFRDQGSIEIGGYDYPPDAKYDVNVSVYRNYFDEPRRRSPRSSRGTFVHAYNNVLHNWGADKGASNGMASGANGALAVIGNCFDAGKVKRTVEARPANPDDPPGLVQHAVDGTDTNLYQDKAEHPDRNDDLQIDARYSALGLEPPVPWVMKPDRADDVKKHAGARLDDWPTEPPGADGASR